MGRPCDAPMQFPGSSVVHRQQLQHLRALAVVVFRSTTCVLMPESVAAAVGQKTVLVAGDMTWHLLSWGTDDSGVVGMAQHGRSRQAEAALPCLRPGVVLCVVQRAGGVCTGALAFCVAYAVLTCPGTG